jgi:hypothetical protein
MLDDYSCAENTQELDLNKLKKIEIRRVLRGRTTTVYSVKRKMLTLQYFLPTMYSVSKYFYEYQRVLTLSPILVIFPSIGR